MPTRQGNYLTTGQAAKLLNVSRSTISRKFDLNVLTGRLNPITGERQISRESVNAFLKDHGLGPVLGGEGRGPAVLVVATREWLVAAVRDAATRDRALDVTAVQYGSDGLMRCSRNTPDLIVLDAAIPDISSEHFVQSLRRNPEGFDVPVLLVRHQQDPASANSSNPTVIVTGDARSDAESLTRAVRECLGLNAGAGASERAHARRWRRADVNLPARISFYGVSAGSRRVSGNATVRNISKGGAFVTGIHLDESFPIREEAFRAVLKVDAPPFDDLEADCMIVRLQSTSDISAGLQFEHISGRSVEQLTSLSL